MDKICNITSKTLSLFPKIKKILNSEKKYLEISEKNGVANFVTSIDIKLNEFIKNSLLTLFPDSLIIAEESENQLFPINNKLKFIVDPLDGTTNFTNNWPHTVSIGIIKDSELASGIIGPISLDILKTALGKENRPNDFNAATWHTEVRAWDIAAATCILRELGGEIVGKDGKPLNINTLSNPNASIAFIASGSEKLIDELYTIYKFSEKKFSYIQN